MPRLTWAFAGRASNFIGFVELRLKLFPSCISAIRRKIKVLSLAKRCATIRFHRIYISFFRNFLNMRLLLLLLFLLFFWGGLLVCLLFSFILFCFVLFCFVPDFYFIGVSKMFFTHSWESALWSSFQRFLVESKAVRKIPSCPSKVLPYFICSIRCRHELKIYY